MLLYRPRPVIHIWALSNLKTIGQISFTPISMEEKSCFYNCLKSAITGGYLRGLIITNTLLKLDQSHSDSDNH